MYAFEPWVDSNLEVVRKSDNEALVRCFNPEHNDSHPSCYFNMETSAYICFACGFCGSLLADPDAFTEDIRQKMIQQRIKKLYEYSVEEVNTVPNSSLARYRAKSSYWDMRHINKRTQELFELGYDPIADAVTIPLRTVEGALIGVTRRFVAPDHVGPRYKYPKGFKASQNLFASWLYENTDMSTVAITEGSIDAMRIWQQGMPAVALYGAVISENHVKTMLKMGVKKVIYFGDGDIAGQKAKERAHGYWQKADGSYRYKEETDLSNQFLMYHITTHFGKKDAGEMTDGEITAAIEGAKLYNPGIKINKYSASTNIRDRLYQLKKKAI